MTAGLAVGEPLMRLLEACYKANVPVLVEGAHGVGKSEVAAQTAARLAIDVRVLDLSLCEPPDLVGLPVLADGRTRFAPPSSLPTSGRGLFVLEELNRAPRHMRAPCLQLLTARTLNDYVLPAGWLPIACANPPPDPNDEDGPTYDVYELDPALRSRFVCVRANVDAELWLGWARANGVHSAVLDVVGREREDALQERGGNPRAWAYASKLLTAFDAVPPSDGVLLAGLAGLLGDVWGVALAEVYRACDRALRPADILERWDAVRPLVQAWIANAREDRVLASWVALRNHISSHRVGSVLSSDARKAGRCYALVECLPPATRSEARLWLDSHLSAFTPPPGRGRPRARGPAHGSP